MVIDWNNLSSFDLYKFKRILGLTKLDDDIENEEVLAIMKHLDKVCISTEDFTKFIAIMSFSMDILDNTTEADDMNCSLYCNLNVSKDIYKLNIIHSEIKQLLVEELDKYLKEFVLWCDSNEVARRALLGEQFINLLSFESYDGSEVVSQHIHPPVYITFREFLLMLCSVGVSKWMEHYLKYNRGASRFMYGREFSKTELCKTICSLKEPIMESFFNNYSEGVISQFRCYGGDYY